MPHITRAVELSGLLAGDGKVYKIPVDTMTGALSTIDIAHHEIHEGETYQISHQGVKNDGQTISAYLQTPNINTWAHILLNWSSGGAAFGRIYEAPTITANTGTSAVAYNRNRNSANTSMVLNNATVPVAGACSTDATKTGDGTIIYTEYAGAGKQEGAMAREDHEFILKQNTKYLFEVESDAAGIQLSLNITWYEEAND